MTPIPLLETSVEGAYDLAIEAAAARIQMITRDGVSTGSSGYASDGELSVTSSSLVDITSVENPMIDSKSSSLNDNSSTGGIQSGSSYSSVDDDDDIDAEISDLNQKQQILERAAYALRREEAYIALNAHSILSGASTPSKLWDEAKHFLDALQNETAAFDDFGDRNNRVSIEPIKSIYPASKRPKIETNMVAHIHSGSFRGSIVTPQSAKVSTDAVSPLEGPTLAGALQFTSLAQ
jgi:hypothetical protein